MERVLARASTSGRTRDASRSKVEARVETYHTVTRSVLEEFSSLSVKVGQVRKDP